MNSNWSYCPENYNLCTISKPTVSSSLSYSPELLNLVKISGFFFVLCDLEIWWTTLKNNMAPLLYYIKLCTSCQSHGWIQTGVTVRKCSNRVKIDDDLSCVSLKFDGWPWKTIGHLFYVASSSVHHLTANSEFKLELLARNTQFGSKSMFFFVPCDLEIWHDLEKQ